MKKDSFNLIEISQWTKDEIVSLPSVQRGFVWRPFQIENLWDSLLRGYPVGAFVLSPKLSEKNEDEFELLDGQQRATAICYGFDTETFNKSNPQIRIFIDIGETRPIGNRKYIFRVITKSHPWGYQKKDNTKPLISENIREAMTLYKDVDDYLEENDLHKFFPYDAILPIPLLFFLESGSEQELQNKIIDWKPWNEILNRWKKNAEKLKEENETNGLSDLKNEQEVWNRILIIYREVVKILDKNSGQKIPALYLDFKSILKEEAYHVSEERITNTNQIKGETKVDDQENQSDAIENLFIRLNSGGTPLNGEDLNYSILKSQINDEKLIVRIENACEGMFHPARLITILFRLYQNQNGKHSVDAVSLKIKPKLFQKEINDKTSKFKCFIENILDNNYNNKSIIEYARYKLEYSKTNLIGLPNITLSKIASEAPEVMFMLLYRIQMGDRFDKDKTLHKRMLGIITLFIWLGKGTKQRDYTKLLRNIWPCINIQNPKIFWSASTVQRAMLNDVLTPFPKINALNSLLKAVNETKRNGDIWRKYDSKTEYLSFIETIFYNKDLIYYSQRQFFSEHFKKEHFILEDTDRPFDLDHISPYKFFNKRNVPSVIKTWYNTNGNYRAWPYTLNRFDQDSVPGKKLNPLKRTTNQENEEKDYIALENDWRKYYKTKLNKRFIPKELSGDILKWSACDSKWATCTVADLKTNYKEILILIIKRNVSLCKEWYDNLQIEALIPLPKKLEFNLIINQNKWKNIKKLSSKVKSVFNTEDKEYWLLKFTEDDSTLYLYLGYPKADKNNLGIELEEDEIEFGIFETNVDGIISKIKVSDKKPNNNYDIGEYYIHGTFTLISYEEDSYIALFNEFRKWIIDFPEKGKKIRLFEKHLVESLTLKFARKIKANINKK